jgi:hypothetical protein
MVVSNIQIPFLFKKEKGMRKPFFYEYYYHKMNKGGENIPYFFSLKTSKMTSLSFAY